MPCAPMLIFYFKRQPMAWTVAAIPSHEGGQIWLNVCKMPSAGEPCGVASNVGPVAGAG